MGELRMVSRRGVVLVLACVSIQLFVLSCGQKRGSSAVSASNPTSVNANNPPATAPLVRSDNLQSPLTVEELTKHVGFLEKGSSEGVIKAWRNVPDHNNFRVAQADDFKVSGRSFDWGEMSGNSGDNLAVILVDQTKPEPNRFALAVFIARANQRYSFYWIFRDKDLSRVTVNRHSGNVYLNEFREDGTQAGYCDIQYSRQQGKWACDL